MTEALAGVPMLWVGDDNQARALFYRWSIYDGATMDIEQVRELRSTLQCRPWNDAHRICVLNGEQLRYWDVLLKMLEELTEDILFVIQTVNLAAIPATVQSRCFVRYAPYKLTRKALSTGGTALIRSAQLCEARLVFESVKEIDDRDAVADMVDWMSSWADSALLDRVNVLLDKVRKGGRPLYAATAIALLAIPAYWEHKNGGR
jgi:hypothetical protein